MGKKSLTLKEQLDQYNSEYISSSKLSISDQEYAKLYQSWLKEIGLTHQTKIAKKVKHKVPMLSLANVFNRDQVESFLKSTRQFLRLPCDHHIDVVVDPKIDGVSISLQYAQGELTAAVSRGTGKEGEDVTSTVRLIPEIPNKLSGEQFPSFMEIRGEIYLPKMSLTYLNDKASGLNQRQFSNVRNAASGILRREESSLDEVRALRFFAYGYGDFRAQSYYDTYLEVLNTLRVWGFPINPLTQVCTSIDEIMNACDAIVSHRDTLEYVIDGAVCKINNLNWRQRLGSDIRTPRWAIAYKFPASMAEATLIGIDIQVGRTGVITPVARISPTRIAGIVVSNASLYNLDYISKLDLRIGDQIVVERAGDVIPRISKCIHDAQHAQRLIYTLPKNCPSCGSTLSINDGNQAYCTNHLDCPAQVHASLLHFVSRDAFDIKGLGPSYLSEFLDSKLVTCSADLFRLTEEKLKTYNEWTTHSAQKLIGTINDRRTVSLPRFIYSLGIPHVGKATSENLAKYFKTISNFCQFQKEDISGLFGIGEIALCSIEAFLENANSRKVLNALLNEVIVKDYQDEKSPEGPLSGEVILFTGHLQSMSRDEARTLAKSKGAGIASSVTRNVTLVIAGTAPGSKIHKAERLRIRIIDESEWLSLISVK